jgi:phosphotriesterase-related protein
MRIMFMGTPDIAATCLKRLIDDGYKNQILLSCDVCLKTCLRTYGGWGYDHVLKNIVPMMEDEGISKEDIKLMLIDNPGNFLDKEII